MNELTDKMLKTYGYDELKELKERIRDYIVPYDKIEWQMMDSYQMTEFMKENYNSDGNAIYWYDNHDQMPIGLVYLVFPKYCKDLKFFVGTIPNRVNKRTIIGCICYKDALISEDCDIVTSIETIEINYFYQGKGLLKEMLVEFSKIVNKKQNIIMTYESAKGKVCHIMNHLQEILRNNGFVNDIRFEDDMDDEYIDSLKR